MTQEARRLVEYYLPGRIYLFGSAVRGDFGPDSGLDRSSGFDARAAHAAASLPATVIREGRLIYDARRIAAWGHAREGAQGIPYLSSEAVSKGARSE
jgi:hypothetical protein